VSDFRLGWRGTAWVMLALCATAIVSPAQTFTSLLSFDWTDGQAPYLVSLVQGTDGNLYGTTMYGGAKKLNAGTVFRITPGGALTSLYSFCGQPGCADGADPYAGLVLGTDGNFYGTTFVSGANDNGTVFKITPAGVLSVLYSFCSQPDCADGSLPTAGLVQGTDGAFYGTTDGGGTSNEGTVFRITAGGVLTTLHSFDRTDGLTPSGLIQGADGSLYGTTLYGGATTACGGAFLGCGTVFKITSGGTLTVLHSFKGNDGNEPIGGLIQGADGNFYGTTYEGGSLSSGCQYGCGTVFKITPGGTLTTLHRFVNTDGGFPTSSLIQATDGNFYGTTGFGGDLSCDSPEGCGTIFKMTPSGALTTLHSFDSTDGSDPSGGLVQATSGTLYGTTASGGTSQTCDYAPCGTIFSLAVGLGPFVETLPAAGTVGASVKILGSKLTGATSVTFNGTPAAFTIVSDSLITTTVPAGATTGTVQVTKPAGTVSSNVPFRVR
jgi:uncharacterized repeat protein (TIGR03803 family)